MNRPGIATALVKCDPKRFNEWLEFRIQDQEEWLVSLKTDEDPDDADWIAKNEAELTALRALRHQPSPIAKIPEIWPPNCCRLLDCPLHPQSTPWNES